MIDDKTVCKAVAVAFVVIILVFFVDKFFIAITILSHLVTEVSATLFKYLLFSQKHVLGFNL